MLLDLSRYHLDNLKITSGGFEREDALLAAWSDTGLPVMTDEDNGPPIRFTLAAYRRGGKLHNLYVSLSEDDDGDVSLSVNVSLSEADDRPARELTNSARALRDFYMYDGLDEVHSHYSATAYFIIPREEFQPLINLPMMETTKSSIPFTRITGLRLSREADSEESSESEYNVILDTYRLEDEFSLTAIYRHIGGSGLDSMREVVKRGVAIRDLFISPVEDGNA